MRNISFKSFDKFSYNHRERNTDKKHTRILILNCTARATFMQQRILFSLSWDLLRWLSASDCISCIIQGYHLPRDVYGNRGDAVLLSRICNCKGVNRQHFLILCISKICNCAHTYIITISRILSCVCYVITSNIISVILPMKLSSKIEI